MNTPVVNISATIFSQDQINVLARGLNYSPTKDFNLYNTLLDVNRFIRNLTFRKHFIKEQKPTIRNYSPITANTQQEYMSFKDQTTVATFRSLDDMPKEEVQYRKYRKCTAPGNKNFYPIQSRTTSMDKCQDLVERDLTILHSKIQNYDQRNLNWVEKEALLELTNNPNIMIRSADIGGAVILLDTELYQQLNMDLLSDTKTYRPMRSDPTVVFQNKLKSLLKYGVDLGIITEHEADRLYVPCPIIPISPSSITKSSLLP